MTAGRMIAVRILAIFLTVQVLTVICYDVHEEIEALRAMYGDHVSYGPCKLQEKGCHDRAKRAVLGSQRPYCDSKLGCFPMTGDFAERPVSFNPNSRDTINTQFTLFTRSNRNRGQKLKADDLQTLTTSSFSNRRQTKFIIHGFLESTKAIWFPPINKEFLDNGDYNVINVDWGGLRGSKTLYTQATANTRVVAREISYLIRMLQRTSGLSTNDVHLIGHSLGSHISGYVGQNFSGTIGRISGLDPAEPYFQGFNTGIRLDPSDAKFVDIIHSDGDSILEITKGEGGFGTSELSGHADFFPNGGEDQPNCKNGILRNINLESDLYEGLKRFFACDHDRAIKYYTESINDCAFTGLLCSDYEDYEKGKCSQSCDATDHCNSMGFHCKKPATSGYKKYYLHTTGNDGSFCATGFLVKIIIGPTSAELEGPLDITISGNAGKEHHFKLNQESKVMKPGKTYTYQLGVATDIGVPIGVEVTWTRDLAWWQVISRACGFVGFCTHSIKIHEIQLISAHGDSHYFCGVGRSYRSGVPRYLFASSKSCLTDASSVIG